MSHSSSRCGAETHHGDPALGFTADVSLFSSFPQVANTPEPQV